MKTDLLSFLYWFTCMGPRRPSTAYSQAFSTFARCPAYMLMVVPLRLNARVCGALLGMKRALAVKEQLAIKCFQAIQFCITMYTWWSQTIVFKKQLITGVSWLATLLHINFRSATTRRENAGGCRYGHIWYGEVCIYICRLNVFTLDRRCRNKTTNFYLLDVSAGGQVFIRILTKAGSPAQTLSKDIFPKVGRLVSALYICNVHTRNCPADYAYTKLKLWRCSRKRAHNSTCKIANFATDA